MEKRKIITQNLEIFEKAYRRNPSSQIKYAIRVYKKELEKFIKE